MNINFNLNKKKYLNLKMELSKAQVNKECMIAHYLNKNVLNDFYPYSANYTFKNKLLTKHFEHTTLFEWEAYVYSRISNIVPSIIDIGHNEWTYDLSGIKPLRYLLREENNSVCYKSLFKFVHSFRDYSLIHGNLKIDNLFMDGNNQFYVIDFTHSIIKEKDTPMIYTDFYSIYNSISTISSSKHLDGLFNKYVPQMGY
jgi:tRNA A-37 threonylcarbamoyl transferase component Bud32